MEYSEEFGSLRVWCSTRDPDQMEVSHEWTKSHAGCVVGSLCRAARGSGEATRRGVVCLGQAKAKLNPASNGSRHHRELQQPSRWGGAGAQAKIRTPLLGEKDFLSLIWRPFSQK